MGNRLSFDTRCVDLNRIGQLDTESIDRNKSAEFLGNLKIWKFYTTEPDAGCYLVCLSCLLNVVVGGLIPLSPWTGICSAFVS